MKNSAKQRVRKQVRELTINELEQVNGGWGGWDSKTKKPKHNDSDHTKNQKEWEKAAKALTGREHHCEITKTKSGTESIKCEPVK